MGEHGLLLDELDDARCWCDRTLEECEEAGGCRWSKEITSLTETGAMLVERVNALNTELEQARSAEQRLSMQVHTLTLSLEVAEGERDTEKARADQLANRVQELEQDRWATVQGMRSTIASMTAAADALDGPEARS
jgi:chromosome segregation ATPase